MQVTLLQKLLSVLLAGALLSPLLTAQASETSNSLTVTLEKTVQFPDLEGEDVLVPAGTYSVKAGDEQFTLIGSDSKAITIEASEGSHFIDVPLPTLVFLSSEEGDTTKTHVLVLYYPEGKTLQAVGNEPEVISRGTLEPTAEDLEYIDPALVTFDQPVYFFSPEGNPILVQPGTYRAESASSGISLIPGQGQNTLLIETEHGTHDTGIPDLLALSLPGGTPEELDLHHVMVLLPTGECLEVTGSYSGIQDRGFFKKKKKSKRWLERK